MEPCVGLAMQTLARPASGHTPDKRGGEKSSVDDLSTGRGVVSQ